MLLAGTYHVRLAEPSATVASVAHRVGYADAFGFSAAFKRVRGLSPSAYRERETAKNVDGQAVGY